MRMEALRQTNYVKSIVTAQGKMDLERKGKQSYQGWMFARLMAFSNGDLQALYDRSDGFYRRQLVLTTKEKPVDRADDPDLAEKMKAEAEEILSLIHISSSCPPPDRFSAESPSGRAWSAAGSPRRGCPPLAETG